MPDWLDNRYLNGRSVWLSEQGCKGGVNTKIHDVVATDGTVVDDDIPSPKSNGVPLLADY